MVVRFNYSAVCISVAEGGRYLPLAELDWQDLPTTLALQVKSARGQG